MEELEAKLLEYKQALAECANDLRGQIQATDDMIQYGGGYGGDTEKEFKSTVANYAHLLEEIGVL